MNTNHSEEPPQACQAILIHGSISVGTSDLQSEVLQGSVVRGRKNPYWQELPQRLVWLREKASMSLSTMTEICGVDEPTIWAIEKGGRANIRTLERIAAALCVPACYLAFGERGERPFSYRIPRSQQPLPICAPSAKPGDELHLGFAARLTQARENRGHSLRELSRRAGLSVTAVSNYERSINLPLVDAVEQLAVALSVSPCWLAYGTGDPPSRNPPEEEPTAEA